MVALCCTFAAVYASPVHHHVPRRYPYRRYYWSLKDYLPPALQEPLALLLTEFVYLPWREAQRAAAAAAAEAAAMLQEGGEAAVAATQGGMQAQADSARAEAVQVLTRRWGGGGAVRAV